MESDTNQIESLDSVLNNLNDSNDHFCNTEFSENEISLSESKIRGLNSKNSRILKKAKRNSGQAYTTKSGRLIKERKCLPLEKCKKDCANKVTSEQQQLLFSRYWSLGSYNERVAFIMSLIVVQGKKTHTLRKGDKPSKNREYSNLYYLEIAGGRINVCQLCFRKCFGETASFLRSVIQKKLTFPMVSYQDSRGIHSPANKISEVQIEQVKNHINSFVVNKGTRKKYLSSDLNLRRMHNLYKGKYAKPVSLTKFSEIFRSMNFKFKSPTKSGACKPCANKSKSGSSQTDSSSIIELKDNAHKSKEKDKLKSINHPAHKVVSFNLGQCLGTPYLRSHSKSRKHQLWTYNFTVHDCATGASHCFMWHEVIAKRGGNEIASCLFKYLTLLTRDGNTKTATFYSDSGLGQNKNSFVAAMFLFVLCFKNSITEINHKFLIPSLTRMECDDDLELIEKKRKESTVKIHHPRDWYNFVRTVKCKNPFNVIEMNQNDFLDFSAVAKNKFVWPNIDEESNKFGWNEIKWLRYRRDNFGFIEYKTSLDENTPFKKINIKKCELEEFLLNDLKSAYKGPLPISIEKKKDLLDILPEIDSCFYSFYENLTTVKQSKNQSDLTEHNVSSKGVKTKLQQT